MHIAIYLNTGCLDDQNDIFRKLFEPIKLLLFVNNYEKYKAIFLYKEVTFFIDNNQRDFFCLNFIKTLGENIRSTTIDNQFQIVKCINQTRIFIGANEVELVYIHKFIHPYVLRKLTEPTHKTYRVNFNFVEQEREIYYINTLETSIYNHFISLTKKKVNKYHIEKTLSDLSLDEFVRYMSKTKELSRHSLKLTKD